MPFINGLGQPKMYQIKLFRNTIRKYVRVFNHMSFGIKMLFHLIYLDINEIIDYYSKGFTV